MIIRNQVVEQLPAGQQPASVTRQEGVSGERERTLLNRLMATEFDHYPARNQALSEGENRRSGGSRTLGNDTVAMEIVG